MIGFFPKPEWLIIGLGNVGARYMRNRHNYGFFAVEDYERKSGGLKWRKKSSFFFAFDPDKKIMLAKPRTLMNLSGIAATNLQRRTGISTQNMLVLYDDLDIPFSQMRIKKKGSHGGHNGMKSIISSLGSSDFPRIRLGIGAEQIENIVDYVLSDFTREEFREVEKVLSSCSDAIDMIVAGRIEEAMNKYN